MNGNGGNPNGGDPYPIKLALIKFQEFSHILSLSHHGLVVFRQYICRKRV